MTQNRQSKRALAEWPLVEAIVRLVVSDATIQLARVAVGGVAPIPLRLPRVEDALLGQPLSHETFQRAVALAAEGASPLPMTGYKVDLLPGTVLETLERTQQRPETRQ
jgi:xanthine dehydrogenase YagS FAD-binding subunit